MRIFILTTNNLYTPFLLRSFFSSKNNEIVGIGISTRHDKSVYKKMWNFYALVGMRYFLSKIAFNLYTRLLQRFNGFLKRESRFKKGWIFIHDLAKLYSIPLYQIDNVNSKEFINILKKIKPTVILSAYFDQILKKEIIEIPDTGCINIHPSLLPYYRGINPTFWVLACAEKKTGVTIHWMDKSIDTGDIILQKELLVSSKDTLNSLNIKCSILGAKMLDEIFSKNIVNLKISFSGQNQKGSSYHSYPTKESYNKFKKLGRKLWKLNENIID